MSRRLYYFDAYTTRFEGSVLEIIDLAGHPAVVLDQSYFYPTSGGQPHDTGTLHQGQLTARVLDVYEREADDAVVHVVDTPLAIGPVTGVIDWDRRLDHMQQHTGQHILSQAFIRVADCETIGFHLSRQTVTIDLICSELPAETVRTAEQLANEIIWENRKIHIREVSKEAVKHLPLRKVPPGQYEAYRLIEIDDFDLSACGGTHVDRSGAVGIVKVIKIEKRGATHRVEFCCGLRALNDYREKHRLAQELTGLLTTGIEDLTPAVFRMQSELKQSRSELKRLRSTLGEMEAAHLLSEAKPAGRWRLVYRVFSDREVSEVRQLGQVLVKSPGVVAFLGIAGDQAQLIFNRSSDAPGNMGELIQPALEHLGSARGGGSASFAQGGGPPANHEVVERAIEAAAANWRELANAIE